LTQEAIELTADCGRCRGLCCVLPAYQRSSDFGHDKAPGVACRHLSPQHRCRIHHDLPARGYPGCVAFDCFGAGQRLSAARDEVSAADLFGLRAQHQLLWLLRQARTYRPPEALLAELHEAEEQVLRRIEKLAGDRVQQAVDVLRRVSEAVRRSSTGMGVDRSGADLVGRDLRAADLRGASLRGALLLGACLDGVDLRGTDLTGADLRGASLRGADLRASLFLHPSQLVPAVGDATTRLPDDLTAPITWV